MAAGRGEVSTEREWSLLWTVTGHGGETSKHLCCWWGWRGPGDKRLWYALIRKVPPASLFLLV